MKGQDTSFYLYFIPFIFHRINRKKYKKRDKTFRYPSVSGFLAISRGMMVQFIFIQITSITYDYMFCFFVDKFITKKFVPFHQLCFNFNIWQLTRLIYRYINMWIKNYFRLSLFVDLVAVKIISFKSRFKSLVSITVFLN